MPIRPGSHFSHPYISFAEIRLNGKLVTSYDKRPQHLQSLTYRRVSTGAGNRLNVSLFDKDWDSFEQMLKPETHIEFRYGYVEGRQSEWYRMRVLEFNPHIVVDGIVANIMAVSEGTIEAGVKSVSFSDKSISGIVEEIAEVRNWKSDVDDTKEVPDYDSLENAAATHMSFEQGAMKDLAFIREVLAPRATRKEDEVSGYMTRFDDAVVGSELSGGTTAPSKPTLHFHPPRYTKVDRDFIYMRARDSEVIEFAPEISGTVRVAMGAGTSAAPRVDRDTGEVAVSLASNKLTPGKPYLGGGGKTWTEPSMDIKNEEYNTTNSYAAPTAGTSDNLAKDKYFENFHGVLKASLTIIGDPTLAPHTVVGVRVFTPEHKMHYTSGLYFVTDISDSVRGGDFYSQLSLIRQGFEVSGFEQIEGVLFEG